MPPIAKVLKTLALATAATLAVQSPASAQVSASGSTLTWFGGDLTIDGIYKKAAYADYLFLFSSTTDFAALAGMTDPFSDATLMSHLVGNNLPTNPTDHTLSFSTTLSLAQLSSIFGLSPSIGGTELVFAVFSDDINRWNFTGDPTRNAQGSYAFAAADINCSTGYNCVVSMEDKSQAEMGPGEPDRNDLIFSVTATPEPASLALLGTGLVGIGAAALRRRRKGA